MTGQDLYVVPLATASRVSALHHLYISYMVISNRNAKFSFVKLHKSWCIGKPPPSLTIAGFPEDTQFCVVETLDKDLEIIKYRRLDKTRAVFGFPELYN